MIKAFLNRLKRRNNPKRQTIEQRLGYWLANGDIGASSLAIAAVMLGAEIQTRRGSCHPHDSADFRRCVILLGYIPEWRDRLPEMRKVNPCWGVLVQHWAKLEAMLNDHKTGSFRVSRAIRELLSGVA